MVALFIIVFFKMYFSTIVDIQCDISLRCTTLWFSPSSFCRQHLGDCHQGKMAFRRASVELRRGSHVGSFHGSFISAKLEMGQLLVAFTLWGWKGLSKGFYDVPLWALLFSSMSQKSVSHWHGSRLERNLLHLLCHFPETFIEHLLEVSPCSVALLC